MRFLIGCNAQCCASAYKITSEELAAINKKSIVVCSSSKLVNLFLDV